MPNFSKIPSWFRKEYMDKFTLTDNKIIQEKAKDCPVIFSYYFLGKKLRLHQAYVIHKILTSKPKSKGIGQRVAICWARQLGKSIGLGAFLIWSCWYNKYPVTISNLTVNYLVSKEVKTSSGICHP